MGRKLCLVIAMMSREQDDNQDVVELPLEDVLDLHPFAPDDIKYLVSDYLDAAYEAGFPEVRIIHGKGIGVQRDIVRSVASRHPYVAGIAAAPEEAGSWGASVITLIKRPDNTAAEK